MLDSWQKSLDCSAAEEEPDGGGQRDGRLRRWPRHSYLWRICNRYSSKIQSLLSFGRLIQSLIGLRPVIQSVIGFGPHACPLIIRNHKLSDDRG
jgi:hypothetical protein